VVSGEPYFLQPFRIDLRTKTVCGYLASDTVQSTLARSRKTMLELNGALSRIHARRDELLLVLDRPDLPLDNNH